MLDKGWSTFDFLDSPIRCRQFLPSNPPPKSTENEPRTSDNGPRSAENGLENPLKMRAIPAENTENRQSSAENCEFQPLFHLFLIHGLHEHGGRYLHLIREICDLGGAVSAVELPGHGGRIDGGEIGPVGTLVRNLAAVEARMAALAGAATAPRLLFGHSLGGLLATLLILRGTGSQIDQSAMKTPPHRFSGALLSAPALSPSVLAAAGWPFWWRMAAELARLGAKNGVLGAKNGVLGSENSENGSKSTKNGSELPKDGSKSPENGSESPENDSKSTTNGSKSPKNGSKSPKNAPDRSKSIQSGPSTPENGKNYRKNPFFSRQIGRLERFLRPFAHVFLDILVRFLLFSIWKIGILWLFPGLRLPPSPLVCRELVISEHFSGENCAESAIFRLKNGKITEKRTENGENGSKTTENGSKMTENGSKMSPNATFAADFLRKHEMDPEMHHKTGFTVNSIRELYKGASFARKILSGPERPALPPIFAVHGLNDTVASPDGSFLLCGLGLKGADFSGKISEDGTQNTENGTQNTENGTQNTESGTQNAENGTQNAENGSKNGEFGPASTGPGCATLRLWRHCRHEVLSDACGPRQAAELARWAAAVARAARQ